MNIVIDTNIFISALIKNGLIRYLIFNCPIQLLFPEFEFLELKKHYQEILSKSSLDEIEFGIIFRTLLGRIKIVRMDATVGHRKKAKEIMDIIDIDDAPFIATALATNSVIWSDDKHFKKQSEIEAYNTKEILALLSENDS